MNKELAQLDARTPAEMRGRICALEECMKAMPEVQVDMDQHTKHHFAPGVYMRELFIPKGVLLTGKIHKTEHLNIVASGEIKVWTEDGMKVIKAPAVIHSMPGIKRVGLALEDTVWITVHATEEKDLGKLEEQLIAKSFDEVLPFIEKPMLEGKGA